MFKVNTMLNAFQKWCVIFAVQYIMSKQYKEIVKHAGPKRLK